MESAINAPWYSQTFLPTHGRRGACHCCHHHLRVGSGYTSARGSESATTWLVLVSVSGSKQDQGLGNGNDNGSTSRATSVCVGLLHMSNALAGSKATSMPLPKSLPVSSTRPLPPTSRTSLKWMGLPETAWLSQSLSVKWVSPQLPLFKV